MTQEQKIIIDNQEYLIADLSQEALTQINNLKITEQEIARQESLLAMLSTARSAYARLLGAAIQENSPATAKESTKANAKESQPAAEKNAKVNAKPATKPATKSKKS